MSTRSKIFTTPSLLTSAVIGGDSVSEIVWKVAGASIPAADTSTVCVPKFGPSVSVLCALPFSSVLVIAVLSVPPPAVTANVTEIPCECKTVFILRFNDKMAETTARRIPLSGYRLRIFQKGGMCLVVKLNRNPSALEDRNMGVDGLIA